MRTPPPIERLVAALRRLPGIGEKSATRLAFHLLGRPEPQVRELAEALLRLQEEIVLCEVCFDLSEASPCALCRDERRDPKLLCVVEEPADRAALERSGRFHGRYFVLGGALSPIDGVGPGEQADLQALWQGLPGDNYQVEAMIHRMIETAAFGVP